MKSFFTLITTCLLFTIADAQTKRPAVTPDRMLFFQCSQQSNKAVLTWSITDNEVYRYFEVQKSTNGKDFTTAGIVFTTENAGTENYMFKGAATDSTTFFRLKLVTVYDQFSYSKTIVLKAQSSPAKSSSIMLLQNPVQSTLQFQYHAAASGDYTIAVYNTSGIRLYKMKADCTTGINTLVLTPHSLLPGSNYILEVQNSSCRSTAFFVKQ
ncbi:MAG: hypothetical protein ICV51_01500 [Flavisolibacter sp.]|nr:hypothetical protein [Flavisolibacter sp.]